MLINKIFAKDTKRAYAGEKVFYVRNVTQTELNLVRTLNENGVRVETPFAYELVTACGRELAPMAYFDNGTKLTYALLESAKQGAYQKMEIMIMHVSEMIGKMHCFGIEHGHPTFNNIVWDEDVKITLIDFSIAEKADIDWTSATSIFNGFIRDYSSIMRRARNKGLNIKFWRRFFENMVGQYPTSMKVKEEVNRLLKKEMRYHWHWFMENKRAYHGIA